jgi:hypothetical protein
MLQRPSCSPSYWELWYTQCQYGSSITNSFINYYGLEYFGAMLQFAKSKQIVQFATFKLTVQFATSKQTVQFNSYQVMLSKVIWLLLSDI